MGSRRRLTLCALRAHLGEGWEGFRLYRVSGLSMTPTLNPGDVVLVEVSAADLPHPGEVVIVRDPLRPQHLLVKRTLSRGEATFAVGSDAPQEARDSRHFGSLRIEDLVGQATWAWSPDSGFRVLRS